MKKWGMVLIILLLTGCGGFETQKSEGQSESLNGRDPRSISFISSMPASLPGTSTAGASAAAGTPAGAASSLPLPDLTTGILPVYGAFGSLGCRLDINDHHANVDLYGGGVYEVSSFAHGSYGAVRVINRSSSYLQLNSAVPVGSFPGKIGEYSVSADFMVGRTYAPYDNDPSTTHVERHPYQPWMGVGEIGNAQVSVPGQQFPTVRWSQPGSQNPTGLSLPPGSCAILNGHTYFPGAMDSTQIQSYRIEVTPQQRGIVVARQPQIDKINICSGADQYTPAQPWTNTTGRPLHIIGATISASTPTGYSVISACLQIFPAGASAPRRVICNSPGGDAVAPIATQGIVELPVEVVNPGELIVYQARHSCSPGGYWGSTAFLHMF